MRTVDAVALMEQLQTFNTSMSQIIDSRNAIMILRAQKRLNIHGYHISKIRLPIESFQTSYDFPFIDHVNQIILRISEARLLRKWMDETLSSFEHFYVEKNLKFAENHSRQSDIDYSDEMPTFIVYGWVASTIVFLFEIIWKKLEALR